MPKQRIILKKTICFLLTILMVLSNLSLSIFAEEFVELSTIGNNMTVAEAVYEITEFNHIEYIDGGTTENPKYTNATDVIDYLMLNHAEIIAQTTNDTIIIPVMGWEDTDGYDSSTADNYSFRAVFGEMPENYSNTNGLEAVIKVTIGAEMVFQLLQEVLADGMYTIEADAMQETVDSPSMTNQFLTEAVKLKVENGQITATVVWNGTAMIPMSWIEGLWYKNAEGTFVELTNTAAIVLDDANNKLTFTLPVSSISEATMMQVYVPNGMGESKPKFRLVFNEETLTKVTEEEPKPEVLADGMYTIEADAMQENVDSPSMTNQFLTEAIQLEVENGQTIATVVWNGTAMIPMSWIEGLWYKNAEGTFVELTNTAAIVLDDANNKLTFTLPVSSIREATMMQVYVPNGMGESKPIFRLVFNEETLTKVTEEEPKPEVLADGMYTIEADAMQENVDSPSMTNQFLTEAIQLEVENGQTIATVVWNGTAMIPMSWIEGLWYKNAEGTFVELTNTAAIVLDVANNKLTFTLPVSSISEATIMQVYVPNGMGESKPKFRLVFKEGTLTKVTEEEPDPDTLADGMYTIEADAMQETVASPSMTNQFLTEAVKLKVENGQTTATVVWNGTAMIPMSWIEGLWYQNAEGNSVELTKTTAVVLDDENNKLTFTLPVSSISEATMMQVYVPNGMGESKPKFRLVFNEETLTKVTEEDTNVEIISFDLITIDGGVEDAAIYENVTAVIAYLNSSYSQVIAQTSHGPIDVPVTNWVDTDSYNPATVGSYTFTANLGELPTGYLNSNNYIAIAKVVVEAGTVLQPADIPDPNLYAALCAILGQDSDTYSITVYDMKGMTGDLDLSNKGITDLTGLSQAVNITGLNLSGNPLGATYTYTEIGSLTKLISLNLSNCSMGTPSTVAHTTATIGSLGNTIMVLPNLESLDVSNNRLQSLGFGLKLNNLKSLDISKNYTGLLRNPMGTMFKDMPKLEVLNVSNSYLYIADGNDNSNILKGIPHVNADNQKNLAELLGVRTPSGEFILEPGQYHKDLGNVVGSTLKLNIVAQAQEITVKIGEQTAQTYTNVMGNKSTDFVVDHIKMGKNTITVETSHENGDTATYTLEVNGSEMPVGDAGIKDFKLHQFICSALGLDPYNHGLTQEDMARLTGLNLSNANISDFSGIEYAVNITSLRLVGNPTTSLPDLSNLTKLTALYIGDNSFADVAEDINWSGLKGLETLSMDKVNIPDASKLDLSELKALKSLSITNSGLENLPDLKALTNLTSLNISGNLLTKLPELNNFPEIRTLNVSDNRLSSLPDLSSLTKITSLNMSSNQFAEVPSTVYGLTNLTTLNLTSNKITTLLEEMKNLSKVRNLNLTGNELELLPDFVGTMDWVTTLNLGSNKLATLPDLSGLKALTTIHLDQNLFVQFPETLCDISTLRTINIADNLLNSIKGDFYKLTAVTIFDISNNPIEKIEADLSKMTGLRTFKAEDCMLTEFPKGLEKISTLVTVELTRNKIKTTPSLEKWVNVEHLSFYFNRLEQFPSGTSSLTKLKFGQFQGNFLTDIPEGALVNLQSIGMLMLQDNYILYTAGSAASDEINALKTLKPLGVIGYDEEVSWKLAALKELKVAGQLVAIERTNGSNYNITINLPESTPDVELITYAVRDNTIITLDGQTKGSGQSLTTTLQEGNNILKLVATNPDDNSLINYNISVNVGEVETTPFPIEGHTYSIEMVMRQAANNDISMSNNYVANQGIIKVIDNQMYFLLTTEDADILYDVKYKDESGEYVAAELVAENSVIKTATYKFPINSIDTYIPLQAFAAPMGYAPYFRMFFEKSTLTDITGAEPNPDTLPNGTYTINASALMENSDSPSMTNQFLTEAFKLKVENRQITATVVWNGTEMIPMSWIEGLWYQNSEGDFVELTNTAAVVLDNENNKLTFTLPVSSISEATMMQVYVPNGMGESKPKFRLVFDENSLVRLGASNPDKEPVKEVISDQGTISISRNDLLGITGQAENIRLNYGNIHIDFPVEYLENYFANDPTGNGKIELQSRETAASIIEGIMKIKADDDVIISSVDFQLQLNSGGDPQVITDLGGRIKITLQLTDEQVVKLEKADKYKLYYNDPTTETLVDMNAVFDLNAKTVVFYTNHFSTYVVLATPKNQNSPGGTGGSTPGSGQSRSGNYSIKVSALQESSNNNSMASQFFTERAQLYYSGNDITVNVIMYGSKTSSELSSGIKMEYIKGLDYRDKNGQWVTAINSLDKSADALSLNFVVDSLDDVYMRVLVPDYMGSSYQIFRLVFDENSLSAGTTRTALSNMPKKYIITASSEEGGSIDPKGDVYVEQGKDQSYTIKADNGYLIKDVLVDDKSVGPVETYKFIGVQKEHSIKALFEKTEKILPKLPEVLVFNDISNHWAKEAIKFVTAQGLFFGTDEGVFSPNEPMTRGMFVTILGRLYGIDTSLYVSSKFIDVNNVQYFSPYVTWAAEKGIVSGVGNNKFEPNRTVTREEAMAIISGYWNFVGVNDLVQPEEGQESIANGRYTVKASALKENSDEHSMTDQMMTEKVRLNVVNGNITASTVWHGTEFITMDMLKELKYQRVDGSFVDVAQVLDKAGNKLTLTFQVANIEEPTIMQVYVPEGMGESKPKFRFVLNLDTMVKSEEQVKEFVDQHEISSWARASVENMQKKGLIRGDSNNKFNPKKSLTRAEAAAIFARMLGFEA